MKWGKRYDYKFVNNLFFSIQKFTENPTKLICFTDDKTNINKNVICKPLPKINLPKQIYFHRFKLSYVFLIKNFT